MIVIKLIFLLLCVNMGTIYSSKILGVFPMPSISHQVVFRKLTQELARRGHELTVITTDPVYPKGKSPDNYTEIDVREISYGVVQKLFQADYKADKDLDRFAEFRRAPFLMGQLLYAQIQTPDVQELLKKDKNTFDLIFIEGLIHPALIFSHVFKAPVIIVSSLGSIYNINSIFGIPSHPVLYPSLMDKRVHNLNIWEKMDNFYTYLAFKYAYYLNEDEENRLLQKIFGPDIPSLRELYNNVDMLFLNTNSIWAENQPIPPNVIYMGGIHQMPENELPKELKTYLDSSKKGVIYLSFGTNILPEMLSPDKIDVMVKVLSNLPYDVLWKWNKDELPGKGDNIKISKWYPQADLLKHPNVKLFITQAGLQSTDEAVTAGVPLVAIPMLSDQWYNAEQYVKHGLGIQLDIKTISEDDFQNAIITIIGNDSYRKNVEKFREVLRDQPESSLERAVWWTEYVIRHKGAKHLRAAGANITYAEYFEVELLLLIISALILILFVSAIFIFLFFRFVSKLFGNKKKLKMN